MRYAIRKPPEQLASQVERVSSRFLEGETILPPSLRARAAFMTPPDLIRLLPKRYELYRALLRQEHSVTNELPEHLRSFARFVGPLNRLDQYIAHHQSGAERTLYEGQLPVFLSFRSFLEKGLTHGFVELPTRTGKTVIFVELAEALGLKTLVVVPTKDLVVQTERRFREFAPDLSLEKVYGGRRAHFDTDVTVITYDSFIRRVRDGRIKPEDYPLVILDEAHEGLSKERARAIRRFIGKSYLFGFTGTPEYDDKKTLKKLLGPEIHRMSVREAVHWGLNCPFVVMLAETEIDLTKIPIVGTEYNMKELEQALDLPALNRSAVDLYKEQFSQEAALVYCCSVKHAESVAAAFNEAGIPAACVHGQNNMEYRGDVLRRMESGELQVLTNVKLLTRAIDIPRASVVLNLCPTLSQVAAKQRGGRALTPNPEDPEKVATIVDFLHRDRRRRRLQMTYSDVVNCAFVMAPGTKHGDTALRERKLREKPAISGLRLSISLQEVLKVLKERRGRAYLASEDAKACDDLGKQIRKRIRSSEDLLLQFPAALKYLQQRERSRHGRKSLQVRGVLKKALEQVCTDFERSAALELPVKNLRIALAQTSEIVRHLGRKFGECALSPSDISKIQESVQNEHGRLTRRISKLDKIGERYGASAKDLLRAADSRIKLEAEDGRTDALRAKLSREDREAASQFLDTLILPFEKRAMMRWDLFLMNYAALGDRGALVRDLEEKLFSRGIELLRQIARHYEAYDPLYLCHETPLPDDEEGIASAEFREELIQEGAFGLHNAIERFRSHYMYRFSSLAEKFITESLEDAINRLYLERGVLAPLPLNLEAQEEEAQYRRTNRSKLRSAELAKRMGISTREAGRLLILLDTARKTPARVTGDEEAAFARASVERSKAADEQQARLTAWANLYEDLSKLPANHNLVLTKYYGLEEREPETLDAVGQVMQLSPERVRQLRLKAEKKLFRQATIRETNAELAEALGCDDERASVLPHPADE